MGLMKYKHAVVGSNFHLQFTPKYRRDVFKDGALIAECKRIFYEIADRFGVAVIGHRLRVCRLMSVA